MQDTENSQHRFHATPEAAPVTLRKQHDTSVPSLQLFFIQVKHFTAHTQDDCTSKQIVNDVVSVTVLVTRWHEVPLASPGGKLLSVAKLMRGGDG